MSGWPERLAFLALAASLGGCVETSPPNPHAPQPTREEKAELSLAYGNWMRARTCATTAAPRPVHGAAQEVARGEGALDRGANAGLASVLAEIDAEYRRIDATIDWSCGDGDMQAPPGFEVGRLRWLKGAVDRLSRAIEAALAPN